jgi:probable rRNA maturation factor
MSIEISNESGVEVDEVALAQLGRFVLDDLRIDPLAELSVLLVDPDAMAALHLQWMDLPGPTDVMAFPMDGVDGPSERFDPSAPPGTDEARAEAMLGDVVLCPVVAADQAASAGHSFEAELHLLCTHGILHLLGYDHGDPQEERVMFELQTRLLSDWVQATGRAPIRTPQPGTGGDVRDAAGGRRG